MLYLNWRAVFVDLIALQVLSQQFLVEFEPMPSVLVRHDFAVEEQTQPSVLFLQILAPVALLYYRVHTLEPIQSPPVLFLLCSSGTQWVEVQYCGLFVTHGSLDTKLLYCVSSLVEMIPHGLL